MTRTREQKAEYCRDWRNKNRQHVRDYRRANQPRSNRQTQKWRRRNLEVAARMRRDSMHKLAAKRGGYLPPPLEADCPPRPKNNLCQRCGKPNMRQGKRVLLVMDHDHDTGAFRMWACARCNHRAHEFAEKH
jgi:hypothetical protein